MNGWRWSDIVTFKYMDPNYKLMDPKFKLRTLNLKAHHRSMCMSIIKKLLVDRFMFIFSGKKGLLNEEHIFVILVAMVVLFVILVAKASRPNENL